MRAGRKVMAVLLAVGAVNLGQGLYLPAKAAFAQFLLQRAWQRGETAPEVIDASLRPWPWADSGNSVIAGHRDTHFRFLADLQAGDRLRIDRRDGSHRIFEVTGLDVVDSRHAAITLDTDRPTLTLVTCYPFDAIEPGGPMRYVVTLQAPR